MKILTRISDSEWQVMSVIWDHPALTSTEICTRLSDSNEWSQKTVNTFLSRLESKGVLDSEKIGRVKHYTALVSENQCQQKESEFFLKKVFRGKVGSALLHFAEQEDLTEEDIAKLRELIDSPKSSKKGNS